MDTREYMGHGGHMMRRGLREVQLNGGVVSVPLSTPQCPEKNPNPLRIPFQNPHNLCNKLTTMLGYRFFQLFSTAVIAVVLGLSHSSAQAGICRDALTPSDLNNIMETVFPHFDGKPTTPGNRIPVARRKVLIITDIAHSGSDSSTGMNAAWRKRIRAARDWAKWIADQRPQEEVHFIVYKNVGQHGGALDAANAPAWEIDFDNPSAPPYSTKDILPGTSHVDLIDRIAQSDIVIAPTKWSTTGPLKKIVKERNRNLMGITIPGYAPSMIPAMKQSLETIERKCKTLHQFMTGAVGSTVEFEVNQGGIVKKFNLWLDLNFRKPQYDSGLVKPGVIANFPSGEAWFAPYEGEFIFNPNSENPTSKIKVPSRTQGVIPVQAGNEILLLTIQENRIIQAENFDGSTRVGPRLEKFREDLINNPMSANVAEFGMGVLASLGVKAIRVTLVDEKLGFHIAFGQSSHIGGTTTAEMFPEGKVMHQDWVYVPKMMPNVSITRVGFFYGDRVFKTLYENGQYFYESDPSVTP